MYVYHISKIKSLKKGVPKIQTYLRNSCRQRSQYLCPHDVTWTGSLIGSRQIKQKHLFRNFSTKQYLYPGILYCSALLLKNYDKTDVLSIQNKHNLASDFWHVCLFLVSILLQRRGKGKLPA